MWIREGGREGERGGGRQREREWEEEGEGERKRETVHASFMHYCCCACWYVARVFARRAGARVSAGLASRRDVYW